MRIRSCLPGPTKGRPPPGVSKGCGYGPDAFGCVRHMAQRAPYHAEKHYGALSSADQTRIPPVDMSPAPARPRRSVPGATASTQVADSENSSADDLADIRYSLSALGEAFVAERRRARFRGFGPCAIAVLPPVG